MPVSDASSMLFTVVLAVVASVAGGVAALAGFGVGGVLGRLPAPWFRRVLAMLLLSLGVYMRAAGAR